MLNLLLEPMPLFSHLMSCVIARNSRGSSSLEAVTLTPLSTMSPTLLEWALFLLKMPSGLIMLSYLGSLPADGPVGSTWKMNQNPFSFIK